MIYAGQPESRLRAVRALERVELSHRERDFATELSGGEQQPAAIARSLINVPGLIPTDEPTGNLDEEAGEALMKTLHDLNAEGRTIVLVTDDDAVDVFRRTGP